MKQIIQFLMTLTVILIFNLPVYTQVFQDWVAIYNGTSNSVDLPQAIKVDASGNIYVTGQSFNIGTSRDYATIRYTPGGTALWVKTYNGEVSGGDYSWALALDNSGDVIVTGRSDRGSPNLSDYTTIKYSPIGVQLWVAHYNGTASNFDEAKAIAVDIAGNIYVTGRSTGTGSLLDIATVKYSPGGTQLWAARYNRPTNMDDVGSSIAVTPTGDVYVAGGSVGTAYDAVLIKYNTNGVFQWVQLYDGVEHGPDMANMVKTVGSNSIYMTGFTFSAANNYDYLTAKYDAQGTLQWVQTYNGPASNSDIASALDLDLNQNVYVTGQSTGTGTNFDYATIKYNSAGVMQWFQRYNGPANGSDIAYAIKTDALGNSYIGGGSFTAANGTDFILIKYNSAGTQRWLAQYNGTGNGADNIRSIDLSNTNDVFVTGESFGIVTDTNYATIRYSQCSLLANAGNDTTIVVGYGSGTATLTASALGGYPPYSYHWSTGDTIQSITVSPTNTTTYIVTITDTLSCSDSDSVTVHVNDVRCGNNGNKVLVCHNGQTICIAAPAVQAHLNHGDYLGNCDTVINISTEKAPGLIGIQQNQIPDFYSLSQNYPNPFNPTTEINFTIPNAGFVELKIYNMLGEEIKTLVNDNIEAGIYSVAFDGSSFASGVYFYSLRSGDFSEIKKMVLIK